MRIMMSWIDPHDGSVSGGVEWPGYFQEAMPAVGDTLIEPIGAGEVQCGRVAERYIYFAPDNEEVWHLVLQYVELQPGRLRALHLRRVVEDVNCFRIDLAMAAAHGLTVERGTPIRDDEKA
ncbi:hypothetical protein ABIB73_005301 [Bradyrhizobium sp. F1.4.3]|uniref:hypothetical protein n=1 Tax=unclassified Bradyrhizobium TaxID=2631580 RepID=UPI003396CDC8